jgi:hypothetical protein
MVRALRDDGLEVAKALTMVAGLNLDDAQERAGILVRGVELKDERQLLASPVSVAAKPQQLGELEPDVVKLRAEPQRSTEFVHRVLRAVQIDVGSGKRSVKIRNLSAAEGVV